MAVSCRRQDHACVRGFVTRAGALGPWAASMLSLVILALVGDEAPAQNGCARCGAPVVRAVAPARTVSTFVERPRRERRWALNMSVQMSPRRNIGGSYTVCVRTCDGGFFPVSYFGADSRADTLGQVCRSLCPNAEVALYSFPFGGTIDEAVSSTGEPYSSLPNAHKFEQSYDPACSCRAPGQSWAEALAAAEEKYGRHSREAPVSVEAAERMSRPIQDSNWKPVAVDAAQTGAMPVGVDVNGVDRSLSAATAAISRETSGIRDVDGQRATRFDLKQGQTVEETAPDGSIRRVRILPSGFGPQ
jgi:Protein of unknown function (DUF2865)